MSPSRARQCPRRPRPISIIGRPHDDRVQVIPTDRPPEGTTSPDARSYLSFAIPAVHGRALRYLADLDLPGRKAACKDLGLLSFRADQLSHHYFTHFTRNSADMADLPAAQRG